MLAKSERDALDRLLAMSAGQVRDEEWQQRYKGTWQGRHPFTQSPALANFSTGLNWERRVVDVIESRCNLREFYLPGQETADELLRDAWLANNLDSESGLVHKDALVYGRGFVSVGSPLNDGDLPVVRVESPRQMAANIDPFTQQITAAVRRIAPDHIGGREYATLYLPDATIWLESTSAGWSERGRDTHNLGRVPLVMFLNRRESGSWSGESEMVDVAELADVARLTLQDLQAAMETAAVPQKYAIGVSKGDFVDSSGNLIPAWQAYYSTVWMSGNGDAKLGTLAAADLSNFHGTLEALAKQASALTGFPLRYFGLSTSNPPSGDAIRADEGEIVATAERKQRAWGTQWGWVAALVHRIHTGEWVDGNRITAEWYDASTPTYAARADAIQKLTGGKPILSRESAWEELRWSPEKIERERERFAAEDTDPALSLLMDRG